MSELTAQQVHEAIKRHITHREKRIAELKSGTIAKDTADTIGKLEHSIMTLLHLEHDLRLCDCPDEAYEKAEEDR